MCDKKKPNHHVIRAKTRGWAVDDAIRQYRVDGVWKEGGGGDYCDVTTGSTNTVAYLDRILHLTNSSTMLAMGNHDSTSRSMFTNATKRNSYYTYQTNGIMFMVLDTTLNTALISGAQLTMVSNTVAALSNQTHLVVVHHHIIWLRGNPDLDVLMSSTNIAASTTALVDPMISLRSESAV